MAEFDSAERVSTYLEAYDTDFDWTGASMGCLSFGYSETSVTVGKYAEGWVMHGYLY